MVRSVKKTQPILVQIASQIAHQRNKEPRAVLLILRQTCLKICRPGGSEPSRTYALLLLLYGEEGLQQ